MKKEVILSTILLSSSLISTIPQDLWAQSANKNIPASVNAKTESLNFLSTETIPYKNHNLTVSISLEKGVYKNIDGANQIPFDLMGSVTFLDEKGNIFAYAGDGDADGNMVFEMANDDAQGTLYNAYNCTSSWTGCALSEMIHLFFSKKNNTWSISFETTISEPFDEGTDKVKANNLPLTEKN